MAREVVIPGVRRFENNEEAIEYDRSEFEWKMSLGDFTLAPFHSKSGIRNFLLASLRHSEYLDANTFRPPTLVSLPNEEDKLASNCQLLEIAVEIDTPKGRTHAIEWFRRKAIEAQKQIKTAQASPDTAFLVPFLTQFYNSCQGTISLLERVDRGVPLLV